MALFNPADATRDVVLRFDSDTDDEVFAGFRVRPVAGTDYDRILKEAAALKQKGETIDVDDIAANVIAHALVASWSSQIPEPEPVAEDEADDMAAEIWRTFPEPHRLELFVAVRDMSRRSPADPKASATSGSSGE